MLSQQQLKSILCVVLLGTKERRRVTAACLHLCFYPKRLTVHSGYAFCQYVCSLGIEPTTFCAANTMLYHWTTGTPRRWVLVSCPWCCGCTEPPPDKLQAKSNVGINPEASKLNMISLFDSCVNIILPTVVWMFGWLWSITHLSIGYLTLSRFICSDAV